jgi:RNA polymerase sigma factor (sigma-70 family)
LSNMLYKELAAEYKITLKHIQKAKEKSQIKSDKEILTQMETSTRWTLEYLQLGHEPGPRRGIHRRSREQREVLLDDMSYIPALVPEEKPDISPEDMEKLEKALSVLTDREREILELVIGQNISYNEAAKILDISKSTVNCTIRRTREKFTRYMKATGKATMKVTESGDVKALAI